MTPEQELDTLAATYCRAGVSGDELARALEAIGWGHTEDTYQAGYDDGYNDGREAALDGGDEWEPDPGARTTVDVPVGGYL